MALRPDSERPEDGAPKDYLDHHPDEDPREWGWHGEWGRASRIAGWIVVVLLLVMITSTAYNFSGGAWLIGIAAVIATMLGWDARRRKNNWRK